VEITCDATATDYGIVPAAYPYIWVDVATYVLDYDAGADFKPLTKTVTTSAGRVLKQTPALLVS
jgi:hypothetical protein